MRVAYTIKADLSRPDGIGLTATKGINGLLAADALYCVYSGDRDSPSDFHWDLSAAANLVVDSNWDTLVAWSNMALAQLGVAKERGAGSVVIRASTHPRHQKRVLAEEAKRVQGQVPSDATVERCEKEFELADIILIPSEVVRNTMVANGVEDSKLFKVPHGVDLEMFHPPAAPSVQFRVCYTGPNWFRKGGVYLLEAMRAVPGAVLEAPGLNCDRVADVVSLYQRSDVYCLPTLEEGQALGILEAAASGCAVVTTEESGALEVLENHKSCLIVPPRDPKAIADALNYLREDPAACREMGRAARAAVEKWGWDRYGRGVVAACEAANHA